MHKWLPNLVAKFWLPNLVLYQTVHISYTNLDEITHFNAFYYNFGNLYFFRWQMNHHLSELVLKRCNSSIKTQILFTYDKEWYAILSSIVFNSLRPSDAIWWHRSGSILTQVMACCLMAPSRYLYQHWLIISKVWWHSSEGNFIRDTSATVHWS